MPPLFNDQFYEELEGIINQVFKSFKSNWIWGVVVLGILLVLILFQQVVLTFLGSYL